MFHSDGSKFRIKKKKQIKKVYFRAAQVSILFVIAFNLMGDNLFLSERSYNGKAIIGYTRTSRRRYKMVKSIKINFLPV